MSSPDQPNDPIDPIAPAGASKESGAAVAPPARPSKPLPKSSEPRRGGGTVALALLLALVAIAGVAYIGWQQWQRQHANAADSQSRASLQQHVAALESDLSNIKGANGSLDQRMSDADQANRSLREDLLGQSSRLRHVEDALAQLAQKSMSGHDVVLLDETESLLRMAAERYQLFHDAQGAAAAYAVADQTMAQVNDGSFSSLRQDINIERNALLKSQPIDQASAMQQLVTLRQSMMTMPLKPLDRGPSNASPDAWSRIGHALAAVITVQRDNGAPLAAADARFARELAQLDLAQAQAALLAYDSKAYAAALQRVQSSLATQFDSDSAEVKQALATVKNLPAALPVTLPVQLGAALKEMRNLRSVNALQPSNSPSGNSPAGASSAAGAATPASAASAASPANATSSRTGPKSPVATPVKQSGGKAATGAKP